MHVSFQKIFYVVASLLGLLAVLIVARTVLIPLAFAFLLAFILYPAVRKIESWGVSQIMSATLSILALFLIIGGGIVLFSNQIIQLSDNLTDFRDKILVLFADITVFINQNVGFVTQLEEGKLIELIRGWFSESMGSLLSQTFSGTASFLVGLVTVTVFLFLILIYRKRLISGFVHFYAPENREQALRMFKSIQKVGQQYLSGMMLIMLILGILNSVGLWIIGIDSPFLFGFLAAALAIIPYVGTLLGAAMPVLYAFMSYNSIWMPISIALFFWFVQAVEGNVLTPKIVGGHMSVNALVSILSIIIGSLVWGIGRV